MPPTFDKTKAEMGTMDEMQFNASLDALLDGENLNSVGSSGANPYSAMPNSISMQTTTAGLPPTQDLLLNPTPVGSGGEQAGAPIGMHIPAVSYGSSGPQSTFPGIPAYSSFGGEQQPHFPSGQASVDSSSIASSNPSGKGKTTKTKSRKHPRDVSAVSEDEEERVRRRQDRNQREQQRSQKITHQIEYLRDVLAAANVQFKPDKYSTLVSVADYIQQLQEKSALLDVEHKKLVDTISRTDEMVNDKYMSTSTNGDDPPGSAQLEGSTSKEGENQDMFVPNIDYQAVFSKCGVPLAVLSIDGRFLECNKEFENLTGFNRAELLPCEKETAGEVQSTVSRNMSLFNLLSREHMEAVFLSMSKMLKNAPDKVTEKIGNASDDTKNDYWSGNVCLSRDMATKLHMNVSLVRSPQGRAKFFDCSLMPLENAVGDRSAA